MLVSDAWKIGAKLPPERLSGANVVAGPGDEIQTKIVGFGLKTPQPFSGGAQVSHQGAARPGPSNPFLVAKEDMGQLVRHEDREFVV